MPEARDLRGVIDTCVVIALDHVDPDELPLEVAISALTLAELELGLHATDEADERFRRQDRLQRTQATFEEPLPVDAEVAQAYGRICAAVVSMGRKARGKRMVDLLIAATALAAELPLYTLDLKDFAGLDKLVRVEVVGLRSESQG